MVGPLEWQSPMASEKKTNVNAWLVILWTAPIPIIIGLFLLYHWYQGKNGTALIASQFIQRQNTVMAYDAVGVSRLVSQIFEHTVTDLKTLPLLQDSPAAISKFMMSRKENISALRSKQ